MPAVGNPPPEATTSGRRRVLAQWIASRDNPLTARVIVNRLWQHHFGRGIVRSTSDFGYLGTPPTHPELLDWLASELVEGGWRFKRLHKQIVMSSVYQMSCSAEFGVRNAEFKKQTDPSHTPHSALRTPHLIDPENDLFWRFELRRLSAEEVRDSILAVCGNLDSSKLGGPSIYPSISKEVLAGQSRPGNGWRQSPPEEQARRSLYVHVKRSLIVPILASFDAADPDASCPVRFTTTVPTQALGMLNGSFAQEQAGVFADDLQRQCNDDAATLVREALWRVTQREPTSQEIEQGVAFLEKLRRDHGMSPHAALSAFCLLMLNLNEFVYLQ
jgi:hypothetical protein